MNFKGIVENKCRVNKIVRFLVITESTVLKYLGMFYTRKIIRSRKDGIETYHAVIDNGICEIISVLNKQ